MEKQEKKEARNQPDVNIVQFLVKSRIFLNEIDCVVWKMQGELEQEKCLRKNRVQEAEINVLFLRETSQANTESSEVLGEEILFVIIYLELTYFQGDFRFHRLCKVCLIM